MKDEPSGKRIDANRTEREMIQVLLNGKVILELGTVKNIRLALLSFGENGLGGSTSWP